MTSRVFVSGLPPTLSESDFRAHFTKQNASVTDIKLIPDRRIGYVGYKSPQEADAAVKYFNSSYVRMSKIGVEIARPVANSISHRERVAASQKGLVDISRKRKRDREDDLGKGDLKDERLDSFLDVMKPASKKNVWANDILSNSTSDSSRHEPNFNLETGSLSHNVSDEPVHTALQNIGKTEIDEKQRNGDFKEKLEGAKKEENVILVDKVGQCALSDADWLRSKTSRLLDLVGEDVDSHLENALSGSTEATQVSGSRGAASEKFDTTAPTQMDLGNQRAKRGDTATDDSISQSSRLFVRNISYTAAEDDFRTHFSQFGTLVEVHIPMDHKAGCNKGFAYISFADTSAAVEAYRTMDGEIFQGRLLHILPAAPKREAKLNEFELSKLPLKKQREIKKKVAASSSHFAWNSMYMNADAVVSSVATRLGLAKADVLDPTSSDAAVRQAHAETHVINETKKYFQQNGVDLNAFGRAAKDDRIILLKNLPAGTKMSDLRDTLCEYGQLRRTVISPSGTLVIVEYSSEPAGKAAFASLSYKRFRESVLFVEKGPKGLFSGDTVKDASVSASTKEGSEKASVSELKSLSTSTSGENESSTLFVRNLDFSTSSERLAEVFSSIDGFLWARIKTKTDPKKGNKVLSMGYGFVEFKNQDQAQAACAAMSGYTLDGHKLIVKTSHKGLDAAAQRQQEDLQKRQTSRRTKIIIKNLPFEATKKDVRSLFQQYGTLRNVRVPKKFGGQTRGFAFAEFVTSKEAENAMQSLQDTHLLGRRLVIQFASQDATNAEEEIDKMQNKIAKQTSAVALERMKANSKRKIQLDTNGNVDAEDGE